jgi:membrane protease YdiL (CAAX protease family)
MSQKIRILQAMLFVAVWMSLGWLFHLTTYTYLLIGVPLCIIFQKFVRRKPLMSCWLRDKPDVRLDWLTLIIAVVFLVVPAGNLILCWQKFGWALRLYFLGCIVGAFGAAITLRHFTKLAVKSLLLCLATAGVFNCGLVALAALARHFVQHEPLITTHHPAVMLVEQFLLLFPVCFVMEEVAFRGILDSHIHDGSSSWLSANSWLSAALLSTLWGWWHLPILSVSQSVAQTLAMIVVLPLFHLVPGIAFSLFWRRTGNLAVPAFVHALIDVVRNVLIGAPT